MFNECRHIKDDGQRCRAAALKDKPYCYFHMKFDRLYKTETLEIPPLEDSTSVLLAIGQVVRALNYETIDCKRAGLMLYGLQIASTVTARRKEANPADSVRSIHNLEGESVEFSEAFVTGAPMLAPENSVCEPPQDCKSCPQIDSCEKRNAALQSARVEDSAEPANGSEEAAHRVREGLFAHMLQQTRLHPESFEHPLPSQEEFHNYFAIKAAAEEDMGTKNAQQGEGDDPIPSSPRSESARIARCETAGGPPMNLGAPYLEEMWEMVELSAAGIVRCETAGAHL